MGWKLCVLILTKSARNDSKFVQRKGLIKSINISLLNLADATFNELNIHIAVRTRLFYDDLKKVE